MARMHGALWALMNSPDEEDEFALLSTGPARFRIPKSKSCSALSASLLPAAITRAASAAAIFSTTAALRPGLPIPSQPIPIPNWAAILKNHADIHDIIGKGLPKDDNILTCNYATEYESENEDMLPPHEIVKKRTTKNHMAYSMCEGIGRTLKGRDLINVRTMVLTMTGYLES